MLRFVHRYGRSVTNEANQPNHHTSPSIFSSLRVRLLSVVLVAVVPVLAVIFHNFLEQRSQIVKDETEDAMALAASAANQAAQTIEGARQLLTAMAHMPQIRNFRSRECSRLLARIEKHFRAYRNVGVATPDGEVVCSAAALPGPINLSGHQWFQLALSARRFTVGQLALEGIAVSPWLPLAYPIVDPKEQLAAVMFIGIESAWLQGMLDRVQLSKPASITFIDSAGTILARRPEAKKWAGKSFPEHPIFKHMVAWHGPGTTEGVGLDGVPRLFGFAPVLSQVEANNIYVRIAIPKAVAFANADRVLFVNLTLLGLFTLIALLAARFGADTLVLRPVSALVRAANRLAAGDLSARSGIPRAKGELHQLAASFDLMAEKLETHEARLLQAVRGTEERHRLLLESTAEGIFGLDIEGRCTFTNKAAATMLGYQAEDCLGKDIDRLTHHSPFDGSSRPVENSFISKAKRFGHTYNNESDIFWRSDRTSFPVDYSSHPIWADGDQISGAVVVFSDISARKRTEATLQQRVQEIEALHEIGQAVLNATDLKNVVEELLDKTLSVGAFDLGAIRLLDPISEMREPVAIRGYRNPEKVRSITTDPNDANFARTQAEVTESRAARVMENVPAAQGLRTIKQEGVESAVFVPARAGDEVLGTILLGSRTPRVFKPEEIRLLEAIGHQLGIAVQKARLNEAMQRNLERIRALHEIGKAIISTLDLRQTLNILLEQIDLFLPYAVTTIRLVNKDTGLLEPVACHNLDEAEWKKIIGQYPGTIDSLVGQYNSPIFNPNVQNDPRPPVADFIKKHGLVSSLRVPLLVKGEIIGVITFFTKEEHEFSDEEIELLTTLAGQAAIAIHNSRLYDEARARGTQLQEANLMLSALHAVAAAVSQSLELDRVLQAAIEKITEIFGLDATRFHIYNQQTDELVLQASFERDSDKFTRARSFKKGQGIVGKALGSAEPLIFEDVDTDPLYRRLSQTKLSTQSGYHFLAVFPIKGKQMNLGTLSCVGTAPRKLGPSEVRLLEAITDQIAVAIENSELYEEVKQKVAELELANKVKDEFLGVMSHELRTPLNVIMGFSSLIRDGMLGEINPEQEEALKKVMSHSTDLLSMLNSILQVTQIGGGNVVAERADVCLSQLLADLESIYELPAAKDITINWDYPPLPVVKTDADKLKQILRNLIDNAIKFTKKGQVTVAARFQESQGQVVFKVSDTGEGIPEEFLPIIFDKFRQLDNSETRMHGGVGLGLYIVKKFTELLGGEISVESEPGKGSVFTVALPVGPQAAPQSRPAER